MSFTLSPLCFIFAQYNLSQVTCENAPPTSRKLEMIPDDSKRTLVLLRHNEFSQPKGWPENIGLAIIDNGTGFLDGYPVHDDEPVEKAVERIEIELDQDLKGCLEYPMPEGADGGHTIDALFDFIQKIESFIAGSEDAIEEAQDFAVNFEFSEDVGIPYNQQKTDSGTDIPVQTEAAEAVDFGAMVSTAVQMSEDKTDESVQIEPAKSRPSSFLDADEVVNAVPPYVGSAIHVSETGDMRISLSGKKKGKTTKDVPMLFRRDRMAVAISKEDLEAAGKADLLTIPKGMIMPPMDVKGMSFPIQAEDVGDHIVFAPAFWAPLPRKQALNTSSVYIFTGMIFSLILGFAVMIWMGRTDPPEPQDPVKRLQMQIFKDKS